MLLLILTAHVALCSTLDARLRVVYDDVIVDVELVMYVDNADLDPLAICATALPSCYDASFVGATLENAKLRRCKMRNDICYILSLSQLLQTDSRREGLWISI